MTPRQISIVQQTFAQVEPIAAVAADLFYGRLFELDPTLRPLFRGDIQEQGKKLMQTMTLAVRGLDDPAPLMPVLRALGKRHAGYGVREEHYGTVASALLWTLERGLGEAFTPEAREAWTAVYTLLATVMQEGAADTAPLTRSA